MRRSKARSRTREASYGWPRRKREVGSPNQRAGVVGPVAEKHRQNAWNSGQEAISNKQRTIIGRHGASENAPATSREGLGRCKQQSGKKPTTSGKQTETRRTEAEPETVMTGVDRIHGPSLSTAKNATLGAAMTMADKSSHKTQPENKNAETTRNIGLKTQALTTAK